MSEAVDQAVRKTEWELIGWFAFQDAIRVRDALMIVGEGSELRRQGPLDPRQDPDYYHLADLF